MTDADGANHPPERPLLRGRDGTVYRFGDVARRRLDIGSSLHAYLETMRQTEDDWNSIKEGLSVENEEVLRRRIERARQDIDEYTEKLSWLESLPEEPETPEDGDGPVIFFRKRFGDPEEMFIPAGGYQYAAVKCEPNKWFITGKNKPSGGALSLTWRELLAFIFMKETAETSPVIWIATVWEQL